MENEVKLANDSLSSFTFHGILDHEKQDYSLHLFEDIHCTDISFRRTDFSFSSFRDCDFKNSIFDRADFLNASFLHVSFQESDFGNALFQNCIFEEVTFRGNKYAHAHFRGCVFLGCTFQNEDWCIEFDNCNFKQCRLSHINNTRSVISCLTFDTVTFSDVDIAECHAEDLVFKACNCENLTVDRERWLSYYYVNSEIHNLQLKYHGKLISAKDDMQSINNLFTQQRYFESLNLVLIGQMASMKNGNASTKGEMKFSRLTKRSVELALKQSPAQRQWNLEHIFKLFEVFYDYPAISLEEYITIIGYLNAINWIEIGIEQDRIEEYLRYYGRATALWQFYQRFRFSNRMLATIRPDAKCVVTIKTQIENIDEFRMLIESAFSQINQRELNRLYEQPLFIELHVEQGCWVVTIGTFMILIACFCRLLTVFGQPIFDLYERNKLHNSIYGRIVNLIDEGRMDNTIQEALKESLRNSISRISDDIPVEDTGVISELSEEVAKLQISEVVLDMLSPLTNG